MPNGKWFLQYEMTMGVLEHDKTVKVKLPATNEKTAMVAAKEEWEKAKTNNGFKPHELKDPRVIQSFYMEE